MVTKLLAAAAFFIALTTLVFAFSQRSALVLRQEQQPYYWARHNTYLSGRYYGNSWQPNPARSTYGAFRGGGPSAGK
ncbi:hypothetical protein H6G89_12840 [Oscillatoria sp. FACHB-1407]|uniref:hypothetical protein n=1 Tax=Oscillatoria sp. FACHB-1407 TaxID=2692847 RepID=UPI001684E16D|nr:hypothetical protein [Oscillatoria sp. FACHB-1407]MBD2461933.1 hypothetical protein [Oscillatoria sp. FACHB-1407]